MPRPEECSTPTLYFTRYDRPVVFGHVRAFVVSLDDEQWPRFAGLVFGGSAFLLAVLLGVLWWDPLPATVTLVVGATLGAGTAGGWAWKHEVEGRDSPSRPRGALVGVFAVGTAYPVMWFCYYLLLPKNVPGVDPGYGAPFQNAWLVLFLLVASVVVTGIVTFPTGAAIGAGLVSLRKRTADSRENEKPDGDRLPDV